MNWFSLALLCAFSLATADALTKRRCSGYTALQMMVVRFVFPGLLLAPLLLLYPLPSVPPVFWGWIAFLLPLELIALSLYMRAIRDAPLYQTLPYLAFTPVINILTGWLLLGEHVSVLGGCGILLVVMGAYLLNVDHARGGAERSWQAPLRAILYQQGSRRMLMVATIYSLTSVGGKAAMLHVGPMSFAVFYFVLLGSVTLVMVAAVRPKELSVLVRQPQWHLLIGGLLVVMELTHFLAMSKIEAAYMVAVKRSSMMFGIIYGAWWFHEQGLLRNFAAAGLMVAGAAMILLA